MVFRAAAITMALTIAPPSWAAPVDDLIDALGVPQMIELMRVEGLEYGEDLANDLLPGGSDAAWKATVSEIYDTERMYDTVQQGFSEDIADSDLEPLLAFFAAPTGQRIVDLEVSAREAMINEDVEAAARDAYIALDGTDDPRLQEMERFVRANDLIEANVVGAMNASFEFYRGLADGGGLEMSESEMLSDVWSQEEETRKDTREWLYAFLLLAYGPLSDEEVARYADLSESPEGKAMNRALFAGFNKMYEDLSYALGLAASRQMQGQEL